MKILFLTPYPLKESPSQRFRFEQYFDILNTKGFRITTQSFLDSHNWEIFFNKGNTIRKSLALMKAFSMRILVLFRLPDVDYVFIHREAAPVGPPVFEWIIAKIFRKKIIYDFDDAIWLTDKISEGKLEKLIRWRTKVRLIAKWSNKVSCGNEYLCNYALQFNRNVILNPTTIDTLHLHNPSLYKKPDEHLITIGWTGSHSTLKYLELLVPVIKRLEFKYTIRFLVIANKKPELALSSLDFLPWRASSEAQDLMQIDIGVMPLPDDEWSRGKCGFKALQYLALEIPAIVSPVGVNTTIVTEGVNGYLCSSAEEWYDKIEVLIKDKILRTQLGNAGRRVVEERYSVSSNADNFLSLFD